LRQRFIRLLGAFTALALSAGFTAACAAARPHHRPAVPAHVETWAFDDGCNGGSGASPSLVRGWLSYGESNCGPAATKALNDCHAGGRTYCKVMQYLDTDWVYNQDNVPLARAAVGNWWLHTPSSLGIYTGLLGGGYLVNQLNPAVQAFFRSYVQDHYDSDDGLLMDWQSPSLTQELYYSTCGCSTTQEIGSDQLLRSAHEQMAAALTHRNGAPFLQANNTLPPNPYLPSGFDMLNPAVGVNGWVIEGQPVDGGVLDANYPTLLDQMAYLDSRANAFMVLLSRSDDGASYQVQSRRIQEATVLLGYQPGHVVDWADLERGNGRLAVWPEEGLYPTAPVQSMRTPGGPGCLAGTGAVCSRGGHNSLLVAPGVYRRVFHACYRGRRRIGPCAAIINTTGSPVVVRRKWLRGASLHHQITFAGGDVQSGGTIRVAGAPFTPGGTVVGPRDAMLLAS
jgi:hypothetical protein